MLNIKSKKVLKGYLKKGFRNMEDNKKEIEHAVIAIDSSSNNSGVVLFLDGKLCEEYSCIVPHAVPTKHKQYKDKLQHLLLLTAETIGTHLTFAIKPKHVTLVIEAPNAPFSKGYRGYGVQQRYLGMWTAAVISHFVICGWDMINKFTYITPTANEWRSILGIKHFKNDKNKYIDFAKQLLPNMEIDLYNYKVPKRTAEGNFKRDNENKILYKQIKAHDLAEALLIGIAYMKKF